MFIPLTLPGETVRAEITTRRGHVWIGHLTEVLSPSADRVEAGCPHFAACGGCSLQHWAADKYAEWKRDLVVSAVSDGSGSAHIASLQRSRGRDRRRADFAIRRSGSQLIIGLHRKRSKEVVDIQTCLVLDPALMALLTPLRATLRSISAIRREGSVVINLLDSGPDVLILGDADLSTGDRAKLAALVHSTGITRFSWSTGRAAAETALLLAPSRTRLSGTDVEPPPGGFLQATADGEAAIVDAVLAAVAHPASSARIVDLYAGSGTLSFALAARAKVDAFEGDATAVASLRNAANRGGLAGRISVTRRDLKESPVSSKDLQRYAAIVLDPPHAGAPGQTAEIARSSVSRVAYVSCNPATLARDALTLRQSGYRVAASTPIDQFLWSSRVESVTVFVRD